MNRTKRIGRTSLLAAAAALLVTAPAIADQAADPQQDQPATPSQPADPAAPSPQPDTETPTQQRDPTMPSPQQDQERTDPTTRDTSKDKTYDKTKMGKKADQGKQAKIDRATLEKMTSNWDAVPRRAIEDFTKKYGDPNEATQSMVIWHDNGVFKRTVVYRDPVQHNFPKPHQAFVEQVVEYKVPADKLDELASYDGSITASRLTGELAVRSDDERMNVLALNLANDIVEGDKDVDEARKEHARTVAQLDRGEMPTTIQKLRFSPMKNAGDPGTSIMDEIEDTQRRGVSQ